MMQAHGLQVAPGEWQASLLPQTETFATLTVARGVAVRGFQHGSYRMENLPGCRDHLFAYRLSGAARAERRVGRSVHRAVTRAGSITIVPAGRASSWAIEGQGRLIYFFLPCSLVAGIAGEVGADDTTEIVERLGVYDQAMGGLAADFAREVELGLAGWSLYAESIVAQLAVLLVRHHSRGRVTLELRRGGLAPAVAKRVLEFIAERLEQDLSLSDLARVAGLATSHFSHSFRTSFGCAPYQFVLRQRVGRARQLLESGRMPLPEIALAAGFASQAHLTTQFRRQVGITPAAYRHSRQA